MIFEKDNIAKSIFKEEYQECADIEVEKLKPIAKFKNANLKIDLDMKQAMDYRVQALEGSKKKGKFNIDVLYYGRYYENMVWV
mmetsp:Transcript_40034/g.29540  ORF Transcript_40034/g.29540 Transcript_40034/m.29540 type:complete len:83 (-) Transcript_40034:447-695(-)